MLREPRPTVEIANDPSEEFLNGYAFFQKGEKLTRENDAAGARSAFQGTVEAMDQILKKWPNWNTSIVEFRRKMAQQKIDQISNPAAPKSKPLAAEPPLPAKSADEAAEKFLSGYQACEEGDRLAQKKDFDGARKAYQSASGAMVEIAKKWPTWNTAIVEFRRKVVERSLKRLDTPEAGRLDGLLGDDESDPLHAKASPEQTEAEAKARLAVKESVCRQQLKQLNEITKRWPEWNSMIVEHRRRLLLQELVRLTTPEALKEEERSPTKLPKPEEYSLDGAPSTVIKIATHPPASDAPVSANNQ